MYSLETQSFILTSTSIDVFRNKMCYPELLKEIFMGAMDCSNRNINQYSSEGNLTVLCKSITGTQKGKVVRYTCIGVHMCAGMSRL